MTEDVTKKECFPKADSDIQVQQKADPIFHLHLILLFFLNFNSCYLGVNFWGFKRVNKYRFCFVLRT